MREALLFYSIQILFVGVFVEKQLCMYLGVFMGLCEYLQYLAVTLTKVLCLCICNLSANV